MKQRTDANNHEGSTRRMSHRALVGSLAVVTLLACTSGAWASEPSQCDAFSIALSNTNTPLAGYGTGYDDGSGPWYEYPQGLDPSWWNQWYYDHPPDDTRWKIIDYLFFISPEVGVPGDYYVEIALNWSTLDYEVGPNGIPPMAGQEQFIVREVIFADFLTSDLELTDTFVVSEFNPEWVSVDVRVRPDIHVNPGMLIIEGDLCHQCVPEPMTVGLLAVGGVALLRKKRRRATCHMAATDLGRPQRS